MQDGSGSMQAAAAAMIESAQGSPTHCGDLEVLLQEMQAHAKVGEAVMHVPGHLQDGSYGRQFLGFQLAGVSAWSYSLQRACHLHSIPAPLLNTKYTLGRQVSGRDRWATRACREHVRILRAGAGNWSCLSLPHSTCHCWESLYQHSGAV
jgi:hypothetical protein